MKGLLLKELALYKSWLLGSAVMSLGVVFILPILLEKYLASVPSVQEIRMGLMFIMLGFSIVNLLVQFNNSLNTDNGKKDTWLHNPNSMHTLIGAKILFSLGIYFIGNIFITTAGIYFLSDMIIGSFAQMLYLQILLLVVLLIAGIILTIIWLLFWTLYVEGKYWTGKFSVILSLVVFLLVVIFLPKVLSFLSIDKLLMQGEVSLKFLGTYLPESATSDFTLDIGSIYIVEEIFMWIIFILLFWFICKWLEKVVTR